MAIEVYPNPDKWASCSACLSRTTKAEELTYMSLSSNERQWTSLRLCKTCKEELTTKLLEAK
jgi:hypothetical protein